MVPNPEIVLAGFRESIDAIEEAYEFMLAYAAQGRLDEDSTSSPNIRELAEKAKAALEKFSQKMGLKEEELCDFGGAEFKEYMMLLSEDAGKSLSGIKLVLTCRPITSQLIDNLNVSIHLRALLTDLFLIDEVLKINQNNG